MQRLLVGGVMAVGILGLVRATRGSIPTLMERMMENVMPNAMDACFAQMDVERRQFMLAHRRRMLDRMEQKHVKAEAT